MNIRCEKYCGMFQFILPAQTIVCPFPFDSILWHRIHFYADIEYYLVYTDYIKQYDATKINFIIYLYSMICVI